MENASSRRQPGTALVTGATGFIGRNLIGRLLSEGWEIHALVRGGSSTSMLEPASRAIVLHEYLGTTEQLMEILAKCTPDLTFHLASAVVVEHQSADIERLIAANVLLGNQLLEAMAKSGSNRIVNVGTGWQHFCGGEYHPVNLYAATKQAFEAILQYYVEAHSIHAVTIKLLDTYGPRDTRPKLINLLKRAQASGQCLPVSPGEQHVNLTYVDDVIEGLRIAGGVVLRSEIPSMMDYAVTSDREISLRELVSLIEKVTSKPVPVTWGGRTYRGREVMVPWNNGTRLPGWCPRVDLEHGLLRTFAEAGR